MGPPYRGSEPGCTHREEESLRGARSPQRPPAVLTLRRKLDRVHPEADPLFFHRRPRAQLKHATGENREHKSTRKQRGNSRTTGGGFVLMWRDLEVAVKVGKRRRYSMECHRASLDVISLFQ